MQKRDAHPTTSSMENQLTRRTLLKTTASAALVVPASATTLQAVAAPEQTSRSSVAGRREQTMNGRLSQARLERMHEVLAGYVERERLPGLVTGLNRRGEVHVDVIGMTAFENGDPMRRDTIFRLASVSKPIVAVAAMTPGRGPHAASRRPRRRTAARAGRPQRLAQHRKPTRRYCPRQPADNAARHADLPAGLRGDLHATRPIPAVAGVGRRGGCRRSKPANASTRRLHEGLQRSAAGASAG